MSDIPLTNLSSVKRRPALVVSTDNARRTDVIVAYVTSVARNEPDAVPITPSLTNGLKVPSMVRFDKIATIDKSIIAGRLGDADAAWLTKHRSTFFGFFGFGRPGA
jgi:mRNA interferase MazF